MKLIKYITLIIMMSLYIFPIEFRFLPSINSKMMLAALGIVTFLVRIATRKQDGISLDVMKSGVLAAIVSVCGLFSVIYNSTNDYTYASYFISFLTWTFAAYFVVISALKLLGSVNADTISILLILVAFVQCILALVIDSWAPFKEAINQVVVGFASMHSAGTGLDAAGRLYGIGAALDVAGTRFSAIIGLTGILCFKAHEDGRKKMEMFYSFVFFFILIIGSFISRTTGIGILFTVLYFFWNRNSSSGLLLPTGCFMAIATFTLYSISPTFHDYIRFGFEGLVNLIESGSWQVNSTDTLKEMYILPETIKTWIIGDGYFNEPSITDANYIGEITDYGLFYMGTDVGYLRFIFYFGTIGLICFILYFIQNAFLCIKRSPHDKWIFINLLLINLTIWFKVATDIYCLFALFLCIRKEYNDSSVKDSDSE